MLHLVIDAVNPRLSLEECAKDWRQILYDLRESARERRYQLEKLGFI
jgi:hypothetical protein